MFSKFHTTCLRVILRWRRFWQQMMHTNLQEQRAGMESLINTFCNLTPYDFTPVTISIPNKNKDGEQNQPAAQTRIMDAEWNQTKGTTSDRYILYLHGGGYCLGSIVSHRELSARISAAAQAKSLVIAYRLAPEHHFPAAVEDAVAAYRFMLAQGIPAQKMAITGDSAGGGLTIATLLSLRDAGDPLPKAAVCMSPWIDMQATGESIVTKAKSDPMLDAKVIAWMARQYLGPHGDPRHPLASPLHADLHGLPPLFIQVGSDEILLDDSRRLAENAEKVGVSVQLQVWPGMTHVWQFFGGWLEEADQAVTQIGNFLRDQIR